MNLKPFRVLTVEDDKSFATSLRQSLESLRHTVECVVSVYERLARARQGDFDVVLADLKLPGPGGLELLGGLKIIGQLRASKPHLPVILTKEMAGERV